MLHNTNVAATIAVKDIQIAKKFYEGTLGLKQVHAEGEAAINYQSGQTTLLVYQSQYAGSNKATAATWDVPKGDLDEIVLSLKGKGVTFEHYDMPGTTRQGDIHEAGDLRVAWFKDPDGNILALVSR
jgi:catechol 2,3-dioxygenase-like lactoylglutathione lyase family enzyme